MNLIPVVDLMQGQVVRAVRGNRHAYQPIVSKLCASSDPLTVAKILCAHCATRQLYVADLDALLGQPAQAALLRTLLQSLPELELWLDAGFAGAAAADALRADLGTAAERVVPVFGSESLVSRSELERCFVPSVSRVTPGRSDRRPNTDAVLSLDRRDGQRLDVAGCWEASQWWPQRVIVMTLERVGANAGPDLDTLREVQRKSPATFIVGAGGVRDERDLAQAADTGAGAWLVASALHDARLPRVRG